ncbi:MAG TPA: hypothetical protein VFH06_02345 [Candidatus Saccharimonadales bacterium]|nr:hypothetical protein [Candidatus Saccharimonadales bacterium]
MNIQRFVHPTDPNEKIFHSNAYARVAHGDSIGSTDTQNFQDRMHVHRNRKAVRHYGDSLIGRGDMRETARTDMDSPLRQAEDASSRQRFNTRGVGVPRRTSPLPPRQSFREPPSRGYNPFA